MSTSASLAILVALAGFSRVTLGQAGSGRDSAAIAATEQRIEAYVVARNLGALERAYASDFRFQHSTGEAQSRAEWLGEVRRARFAARTVDSLAVELHGDVALVTGRLHVLRAPTDPSWVTDPEWRDYTIRYTRVYARRDGGWRLLTHHSTSQAFGPPAGATAAPPAR